MPLDSPLSQFQVKVTFQRFASSNIESNFQVINSEVSGINGKFKRNQLNKLAIYRLKLLKACNSKGFERYLKIFISDVWSEMKLIFILRPRFAKQRKRGQILLEIPSFQCCNRQLLIQSSVECLRRNHELLKFVNFERIQRLKMF